MADGRRPLLLRRSQVGDWPIFAAGEGGGPPSAREVPALLGMPTVEAYVQDALKHERAHE